VQRAPRRASPESRYTVAAAKLFVLIETARRRESLSSDNARYDERQLPLISRRADKIFSLVPVISIR
jgi:hypothetical protein